MAVINYEAIWEVITTPLNKLYNETSEYVRLLWYERFDKKWLAKELKHKIGD